MRTRIRWGHLNYWLHFSAKCKDPNSSISNRELSGPIFNALKKGIYTFLDNLLLLLERFFLEHWRWIWFPRMWIHNIARWNDRKQVLTFFCMTFFQVWKMVLYAPKYFLFKLKQVHLLLMRLSLKILELPCCYFSNLFYFPWILSESWWPDLDMAFVLWFDQSRIKWSCSFSWFENTISVDVV